MYNVRDNIQASLGHFRMEGYWFRYSSFVPRLYNWCRELGFDAGKIMPSRAFCSDESQGYPVILLAKHIRLARLEFAMSHALTNACSCRGVSELHCFHNKLSGCI